MGTRRHRQKTQPRCTPIRWARKEKWCLKYEGASSTPRKPQVTKKHTRPALVTKGLALWWTSAKPYHAHPPSRTRQREDHLILTKHHTISALGHTMSTCEGDGGREIEKHGCLGGWLLRCLSLLAGSNRLFSIPPAGYFFVPASPGTILRFSLIWILLRLYSLL